MPVGLWLWAYACISHTPSLKTFCNLIASIERVLPMRYWHSAATSSCRSRKFFRKIFMAAFIITWRLLKERENPPNVLKEVEKVRQYVVASVMHNGECRPAKARVDALMQVL